MAAIERRNVAKAKLLYDFLDATTFYENRVDPDCRSRMNVPFFLADESGTRPFLAGARNRSAAVEGRHKSVGGMRASIWQRDADRRRQRAGGLHA